MHASYVRASSTFILCSMRNYHNNEHSLYLAQQPLHCVRYGNRTQYSEQAVFLAQHLPAGRRGGGWGVAYGLQNRQQGHQVHRPTFPPLQIARGRFFDSFCLPVGRCIRRMCLRLSLFTE